ncbi:AAA family ATPase [Ruminococcus sp.]|uniref:AAA family ATPase n=1 Tax=Ruminococcus sp. TaxID=41978 RepID=UPI002E7A02A7|nr:AAA family ATPase [Ruminococcus sp.]MEE0740653.1 AAA family ATPase [Ruminococcus sp.]
MRIRHVKIDNFRGIKHAELTFPTEQRLICLIGAGDSTKSTVLTAIHFTLWPSWNLIISSSDFYECNTEEHIVIKELLNIAMICNKKEFFKRVAGGEALGRAIFDNCKNISSDMEEIKTINEIVKWINYGKDTRIFK